MIQFMIAMVPLLLTLLATMGSIVTVSVLHPLIIFMIHVVRGDHLHRGLSAAVLLGSAAYRKRDFGQVQGDTACECAAKSQRWTDGRDADGVPRRHFGSGSDRIGDRWSYDADGQIRHRQFRARVSGEPSPMRQIRLFRPRCWSRMQSVLPASSSFFSYAAFPAVKILTLALIYNVSAAVMQPLGRQSDRRLPTDDRQNADLRFRRSRSCRADVLSCRNDYFNRGQRSGDGSLKLHCAAGNEPYGRRGRAMLNWLSSWLQQIIAVVAAGRLNRFAAS